jgi:hypothetical protein
MPKANRSGPIDWTKYKYLDTVHMDIVFEVCLLVGSFCYAPILVDWATRYKWAFGSKNLSSHSILSVIQLFCGSACSLARCFYCNCDLKLFGTAISKYLIDNQSKVVATPAKQQSPNGMVEPDWKPMVHMAQAYLTKKQMLHTFWFYTILHSAWMMNAIPGTISGHLAPPFLLVNGVDHAKQTQISVFSLCYFHHEKDSNQQ